MYLIYHSYTDLRNKAESRGQNVVCFWQGNTISLLKLTHQQVNLKRDLESEVQIWTFLCHGWQPKNKTKISTIRVFKLMLFQHFEYSCPLKSSFNLSQELLSFSWLKYYVTKKFDIFFFNNKNRFRNKCTWGEWTCYL